MNLYQNPQADQTSLLQVWESVFTTVNTFLVQHSKFEVHLLCSLIEPSLEDFIFNLRLMQALLVALEPRLVASDMRLLLNAKQQIILFEQAVITLRDKDYAAYAKIVTSLQKQAQF